MIKIINGAINVNAWGLVYGFLGWGGIIVGGGREGTANVRVSAQVLVIAVVRWEL